MHKQKTKITREASAFRVIFFATEDLGTRTYKAEKDELLPQPTCCCQALPYGVSLCLSLDTSTRLGSLVNVPKGTKRT
jgi:hypothetical protein